MEQSRPGITGVQAKQFTPSLVVHNRLRVCSPIAKLWLKHPLLSPRVLASGWLPLGAKLCSQKGPMSGKEVRLR